MLEQPWPPPGPQQPRDAHAQHWANDVAGVGGARSSSVGPDRQDDVPAREPAARRRGTGGRSTPDAVDRRAQDGPSDDGPEGWLPDGRGHGTGAPEARPRPLPARWVPQEEWIPDPTPAPEQRWTPEQDWLSAFADRSDESAGTDAPVRRSRGRRWLVALVGALPFAMALAVVAARL